MSNTASLGAKSDTNRSAFAVRVTVFAAWLVLAITGASVLAKILHFDLYVDILGQSPVVPRSFATPAAALSIAVQVAAIGAATLRRFQRTSFLALTFFYSIACIFSLIRIMHPANVECGCFPGYIDLRPTQSIPITLVLVGLSVFCFQAHKNTARCFAQYPQFSLPVAFSVLLSSVAILVLSQRIHTGNKETGSVVALNQEDRALINQIERTRISDNAVVLVFSDFDCEACHQLFTRLEIVQKANPRLQVEIHYLPVASIHPNAIGKAVTFEMLRLMNLIDSQQGFALAQGASDQTWKSLVDAAAKDPHYDSFLKLAKANVTKDMQSAQKLSIQEIPAVFLLSRSVSEYLSDDSKLSEEATRVLQ